MHKLFQFLLSLGFLNNDNKKGMPEILIINSQAFLVINKHANNFVLITQSRQTNMLGKCSERARWCSFHQQPIASSAAPPFACLHTDRQTAANGAFRRMLKRPKPYTHTQFSHRLTWPSGVFQSNHYRKKRQITEKAEVKSRTLLFAKGGAAVKV